MEILIVDLETTGLSAKADAIVEIGIVLVDTDTGKFKKVFDKVVKHKGMWNSFKHKHSWIFQNTNLRPEEVSKAQDLETYRDEIQEWFDKHKITAYNLPFDSRFLEAAGFKFEKIKCIMSGCQPYSNFLDKRGRRKKPKVVEIYNQFFMDHTDDVYEEDHRAGQDALDEARILLHLVKMKKEGKVPKMKKIVEAATKNAKSKAPQSNHPVYKPIGLKDKFPFGKHKGKPVSEIIKTNTKYIGWCLSKVKTFELKSDAKKLYDKLASDE